MSVIDFQYTLRSFIIIHKNVAQPTDHFHLMFLCFCPDLLRSSVTLLVLQVIKH